MLLINSYISESFSFNIEKSSITYFTSDSYLVQFSKKQEAPFQRSALINIRYFNEQEIINGRHIMNLEVFFISYNLYQCQREPIWRCESVSS